jgi:signal transduction histidine kinase
MVTTVEHPVRRSSPRSHCCPRCDAVAAENARLRRDLRERSNELRSARARGIQAADAERRRLERNLHDGAQQRLVALALELRMLAGRLAPDSEAERLLDTAREHLQASLDELRELAHGLHPAVLSSHGLAVALESLAARAPFEVELTVELDERPDQAAEVAAYYVIAEALTNGAKYACASKATVTIAGAPGALLVVVADDGVGGADPSVGSGLSGLAERVEALGGRLSVTSPSGEGTTVAATIPSSNCPRAQRAGRTLAFAR